MAVASLLIGIVTCAFCWLYLVNAPAGLILICVGVVGIILGATACKYSKNRGVAKAGLVMSIIDTAIPITIVAGFYACYTCLGNSMEGCLNSISAYTDI